MSNIFLIRHAFTPANNANYNNQEGLWKIALNKDMPIEKKYGVNQALELGQFLDKFKGKILIYVSPYLRTRQTLEYALSKMNKHYEIKVSDELTEFNSGIHYAHTIDEVLRMHPESEKYFIDAKKDLDNAVYTKGESRNDVKKRVKNIALEIKNIALSNEYDYIFVFAHGTVNQFLNYWLNGNIINHDMKNCEVFDVNKNKTVFIPKTTFPKGMMINIDEYV